MSDSAVAAKKSGSLNLLSKDELVSKCKTLLQIAQKAKKSKDDAMEQIVILQEDIIKERNGSLRQINHLENKIGSLEDGINAKQRQLDRLSEENDMLLDQVDVFSSQLKVFAQEKSATDCKLADLRNEILANSDERSKKEIDQLSVVEQDLLSLREELEESNKRNYDVNITCNKYREKVGLLTTTLDDLQEQQNLLRDKLRTSEAHVENVKKDLQVNKEEGKKNAQEAQVAKAEIVKLKENLEIASSNLRIVNDEKQLLEDKAEELKIQVLQLEKSCLIRQEELNKAHGDSKSMSNEYARVQTELETVKLELNDVYKENLRVAGLETNLHDLKLDLQSKEEAFVKLSKEFENYKVRAQNVLKQSKEKSFIDIEELQKLKEESLGMEKANKTLSEKLESANMQIRTLYAERDQLKDDYKTCEEKSIQVSEKFEAREKILRDKYEELETTIRQMEMEKIRDKERWEMMMNNMQENQLLELKRIEDKSMEELTTLRHILDITKDEVTGLESELKKEQEKAGKCEDKFIGSKQTQIVHHTRENESQTCEAKGINAKISHTPAFLPLDQLLFQNDIADPKSDSSYAGLGDRQVLHLAALLSEAEAQNSRLEKLTEVLKEEIRTYQRSEERYKHIENLEYIKNVFLKFLTLSSAQERMRLIPVLKTILKLKKEETNQIEELVRTEDKMTDGWGKYMSIWPSNH